MSGGKPNPPPTLTDANVFYDGFVEAANKPDPYGGRGCYPQPLDSDLNTFVRAPAGPNSHWITNEGESLRQQKQLIVLLMMLGRRLDTIIENNKTIHQDNEAIMKNNAASSEAIVRSLSTMTEALATISKQQAAGTERIVKSLQELKAAINHG
jgi:hypothetical protein